jgi:hypothetical protein
LLGSNQAQVGFVNKSRRLQGVAGGLVGHLGCGQTAKLFVHQGKQSVRRAGVPLLGAFEHAGDLIHSATDTTNHRAQEG